MDASSSPPQNVKEQASTAVPVVHADARATPSPLQLSLSTFPPVEVYTSSSGAKSEVLHLGAHPDKVGDPCSPHTHVVVLPGNPGVVEFYRPLMRMLHSKLPDAVRARVSVHALGLPGHDLLAQNGARVFTIEEQVGHAAEYVRRLEGPVLLVGHSLGAYVSVRVVQAVGARRCSVALVTPTLWRLRQCTGVFARALAADWRGVCSWAACALARAVPECVRRAVIRAARYYEGVRDVASRVADGRRLGLYRNVCALGRDAMRCVVAPADVGVGARSVLVWVERDARCPAEARARIAERFAGCRVVQATGCAHAVVLDERDTRVVGGILAEWVCERVLDGG